MLCRINNKISAKILRYRRLASFKLANYTTPPLAVFGFSRGGTTHFAELLGKYPYNVAWEPLTNSYYRERLIDLQQVLGDPEAVPKARSIV